MNVEMEIEGVSQDVMVEVYRDINPGYRTVIVWISDGEDNYIEASVSNIGNNIYISPHSVEFPSLDTAEEIVRTAMELTDGILGLEDEGGYECDSGYGSDGESGSESEGEPLDIPEGW